MANGEIVSGNLKSALLDYRTESSSGPSEQQSVRVARDTTNLYDLIDYQDEGELPGGLIYSFESAKNARTGDIERSFNFGDIQMIKSGSEYRYLQSGKPISEEEAMSQIQKNLSGLKKEDLDYFSSLSKSVTPMVGAESRSPIAHPKYKGEIPEYFDEERIFYESFGEEPVSKKKDKQELLISNVPPKRGR